MAIDYRLQDGLVEGIDPYLELVAPGILSDDGYFRHAKDIERFTRIWERYKPSADSIVCSVSRDSSDQHYDYFAVYATKGRNGKGFDSPVVGWVSVFLRDAHTGQWIGDEFVRVQEDG